MASELREERGGALSLLGRLIALSLIQGEGRTALITDSDDVEYAGLREALEAEGFTTAIPLKARESLGELVTAAVLLPSWVTWQDETRRLPRLLGAGDLLAEHMETMSHDVERLGVLLYAGLQIQRGAAEFRNRVAATWTVETVIETTAPVGRQSTREPEVGDARLQGARVAFIVFGRAEKRQILPRFFRYEPNEVDESLVEEFENLLRRTGGKTQHGYVRREPIKSTGGWGFDQNNPAHVVRAQELAQFGSLETIGDVFDVLRTRGRRTQVDPGATGRVVLSRDIGIDGTVRASFVRHVKLLPGETLKLLKGDIVAHSLRSQGVVAGVVTEDLAGTIAGRHVIVFRSKRTLLPADMQFFAAYLRSQEFARQAAAAGAATDPLEGFDLEAVSLPRVDDDLRAALDVVLAARRELIEWAETASRTFESAFTFQDVNEARRHVLERGREMRQRVSAIRQVSDLGFRIRTQYPYPVAYQWRTVESVLHSHDPMELLRTVLECFESSVSFIANLVLAVSREQALEVGAMTDISTKLKTGRGGLTLGDWQKCIDETNSRRFRSQSDDSVIGLIRQFRNETEKERRALASWRNDLAHQRKLSPSRQAEVAGEAVETLRFVLSEAAFLADFSLAYVDRSDWQPIQQRSIISYRRLVGDHPVVPTDLREVPGEHVGARSLYLMDAYQKMHLLSPFLIGKECPDCQSWHTFHIDRQDKGELLLISLERGHSTTHPGLAQDLEAIGLI